MKPGKKQAQSPVERHIDEENFMNIRYARPKETDAVRRLWEEGFGNSQPYTDWYFQEVYRPERCICLFGEEEMAACLQVAPYRIQLQGRVQNAAYLVGVVTAASQRGKGFGHALLHYALHQLKISGFKLALLHTEIPEFYTPLGFSPCYQLRQQRFPAEEAGLPPGWAKPEPGPMELARCEQIYRRMCQGWNGYILRSPENWQNFVREQLLDGGELWLSHRAYLLGSVEKESFRIRELGYMDTTALEEGIRLGKTLAERTVRPCLDWPAPLSAPVLGEDLGCLTHVLCRRVDTPEAWPPESTALATQELFPGAAEINWVNETT